MWFERKNRAEINYRPIPELKVTPYSPYGNLRYLPSKKTMDISGLPLGPYLLQTVLGHATIFRKEGIFNFRIMYENNVVLIKGEYVEELLRSTTYLEKGALYNMLHPWLGTGLLTSYGSKWKSRRKLMTPSFHFDILRDFLPVFNDQSKVLVDIMKQQADKEWVDIVHLITLCSLDIMCETILGARVGAQQDSDSDYVQAVLSASQLVMERMSSPLLNWDIFFQMSSFGRQFKKNLECLHGFTRKVIQQKKDSLKSSRVQSDGCISENSEGNNGKRKRKALMDLLLDVHLNNQTFTEEDVREEVDTFAFEGHDTTSMGMSWALYLIGLYPEVQNNIHEELDRIFGTDVERPVCVEDLKEMEYLERVLKESQRLYPSVPFFSRKIHKDFELHGYRITKGSTVVVNNYLLHRNPEAFPNPEKFDPDRFLPERCVGRNPFSYVPFSAGPRNCIGQRFAVMEEKVVISNILRNFRLKSLEQRDQVFPAPELILRSMFPLKLKVIPRDRS